MGAFSIGLTQQEEQLLLDPKKMRDRLAPDRTRASGGQRKNRDLEGANGPRRVRRSSSDTWVAVEKEIVGPRKAPKRFAELPTDGGASPTTSCSGNFELRAPRLHSLADGLDGTLDPYPRPRHDADLFSRHRSTASSPTSRRWLKSLRLDLLRERVPLGASAGNDPRAGREDCRGDGDRRRGPRLGLWSRRGRWAELKDGHRGAASWIGFAAEPDRLPRLHGHGADPFVARCFSSCSRRTRRPGRRDRGPGAGPVSRLSRR